METSLFDLFMFKLQSCKSTFIGFINHRRVAAPEAGVVCSLSASRDLAGSPTDSSIAHMQILDNGEHSRV